MKKQNIPFFLSGLGLLLMVIVFKGSQPTDDSATELPLLTLLAMSEVAFFALAYGVYVGVQHLRQTGLQIAYGLVTLLCGLLAIGFMWQGIRLWPL